MGLPRFWGRWLSRYAQLFVFRPDGRISSLLIDGNGLLYDAVETLKLQLVAGATPEQAEEQFFAILFQMLRDILDRYAPEDCFVLCFDGVCPILKMQHQWERRSKSALSGPSSSPIDTLQFSPGTDLMLRIEARVKQWLEKTWSEGWQAAPTSDIRQFRTGEAAPKLTPLPKRVLFSGPSIPGEGEHKIMEYLRQGLVTGAGAHVVYGKDADLAVLCLAVKKPKLYLARTHLQDERGRDPQLLPIDALRLQIIEKLGSPDIDDFVVLVSLIGNDFLPMVPGLGQIPDNLDFLTQCYWKLRYRLVVDGELQLGPLRDFFVLLVEGRDRLYESLGKYRQHPFAASVAQTIVDQTPPARYVGETPETKLLVRTDYPRYRDLWYRQWGLGDFGTLTVQSVAGPVEEMVAGVGNSGPTLLSALGPLASALPANLVSELTSAENWAREIAEDFFAVLRWIVSYYLLGQKFVNWNLSYPHFRAPLAEDLLAYLLTLPAWPDKPHRATEAFRLQVWHQMAVIIPRQSALPEWLRPVVVSRFPDTRPSSFVVTSEGVPDDPKWGQEARTGPAVRLPDQAVAYVPLIDPERVFTELAKVQLPKGALDRYAAGSLLILDLEDPRTRQELQAGLALRVTSDPRLLRSLVVGGQAPKGKGSKPVPKVAPPKPAAAPKAPGPKASPPRGAPAEAPEEYRIGQSALVPAVAILPEGWPSSSAVFIQTAGGLPQAVAALDNLIQSGRLPFPFRSYFVDPPAVMMERLRSFVPVPVRASYRLKSYRPKSSRPALYVPPLYQGQPVYLLGRPADYAAIDILTDHFIEDVRLRTHRPGEPSVQDYWSKPELRQQFLQKALQQPTIDLPSLREALYQMTLESDHFRPTWVLGLYQVLGLPAGSRILDISAGWGDRLVAAIAQGHSYLGFDPNRELEPGHSRIIQAFGTGAQKVIYQPFETVKPEELGNNFDLVLTSPPFERTEIYSEDPSQSTSKFPTLRDWFRGFLFPSLRLAWGALRPGGLLALHLGDPEKPDLRLAEATNLWIEENLPNASWQGVIGVSGRSGSARPVWVWQKALPGNAVTRWNPTVKRSLQQYYPELAQ